MLKTLCCNPVFAGKSIMGYRNMAMMKLLVAWALLTCCYTSVPSSQVARKSHLRVGVINYYPIVIVKLDENQNITSVGGFSYEIFEWLSRRLHFTFSFFLPREEGFYKRNGTWRGLARDFHEQKVDLGLISLTLTAVRAELVDYSFPWLWQSFALLLPYPQPESKFWASFYPFKLQVWLATVGSFAAMVFAFHVTKSPAKGNFATGYATMYMAGVLTAQGGHMVTKVRAVQLLVVTWCLAAFVLVNGYTSSLVQYLAVPLKKPLVSSIEEVAERGDIKVYTQDDNFIDLAFKEATSGIYKKIGDVRRYYGGLVCMKLSLCKTTVRDEPRAVFTTDMEIVDTLISDSFVQTKSCLYTRAPETFQPTLAGFPLPKGDPFNRLLDKEIIRCMEFGLLNYWHDKYFRRASQCLSYRSPPPQPVLSLKDLASAFIILFFGYFTATLALICETVTYRKTRRLSRI